MNSGLRNWPARHPVATLGIAALVALLSALTASRLRPDPSLRSLFPRHDPAADAMMDVLENYPSADELLILALEPSTIGRMNNRGNSFQTSSYRMESSTSLIRSLRPLLTG
jgi:predicted RND superfamily exporter protein